MTVADIERFLGRLAIPAFASRLDETGAPVFVHLNAAHTALTGLRTEDICGRSPIEVFGPKRGEKVMERHLRAITTGRPISFNHWLLMPHGEFACRTTLSPIPAEGDDGPGLIGTMAILSDLATAKSELAGVGPEREARQAESEKLIAMAAHDLRSPLRRIGKMADMLRENLMDIRFPEDDDTHEILDLIDEVVTRAGDLTTDVLNFAEAQETVETVETFDIGALCMTTAAALDPTSAPRIEAPVGCEVTADRTAIAITMRNLIDNAFKHGGKPDLRLRVEVRQARSDMLEFRIVDDGEGFGEIKMAFLSSGEVRYGCGFGLVGVRGLVLRRGGSIAAEPPGPGEGAVIRLLMPGRIVAAAGSVPANTDETTLTVPA